MLTIELPEPLLVFRGAPLVYPALGARFYLEPLTPEDRRRIQAVIEHLAAWIGPYLKQTNHAYIAGIEPFTKDHLESFQAMVPRPPGANDGPLAPLLDAMEADYSVDCNGADEPHFASPYMCGCVTSALHQDDEASAWPRDFDDPDDDFHLPERPPLVLGYLDLTVPPAWPIDDFKGRVLAIASLLRLRWATAGLTYATWLAYEVVEGPKTVYAHARRHPGFDVGYSAILPRWQDQVRTANWLTVLGPDLHGKAERYWGERFATEGYVVVSKLGDNGVIQAGEKPEGGDINRLDVPKAYVQADAMLRGIMPNSSTEITFPGPWDASSIGEWLNRFRKHVRPYSLS